MLSVLILMMMVTSSSRKTVGQSTLFAQFSVLSSELQFLTSTQSAPSASQFLPFP